ncbi:MAG: VWA domain-containing protein [Planctomycetota bacterium]
MTTLPDLGLRDPELLALWPLTAALWWRFGRPLPQGIPFAGTAILSHDAGGLPQSLRQRLRLLPTALVLLGVGLACIALARPVRTIRLPRVREGIDLQLLLDRSSSMAETMPGSNGRSRFEVVRESARQFVESRPDDRFALSTFARYPDAVCPSTTDHEALLSLLDVVDLAATDSDEDLTGIGTGLAFAVNSLRRSTASSRVCVLLTDGDENVATDLSPDEIRAAEAVELARTSGIRVYTIFAATSRRRADGSLEEADASLLQSIARSTGGQFFRALDRDGLRSAYQQIQDLEQSPFEIERTRIEDRVEPFLLAAALTTILGLALSSTLFRRLP